MCKYNFSREKYLDFRDDIIRVDEQNDWLYNKPLQLQTASIFKQVYIFFLLFECKCISM